MENKIIKLLIFLMKTGGKKCPPDHFFPIDEKKLLIIASRNKAIPFLFHFLDCSTCNQRLNKNTIEKISSLKKFALIWLLFYQDEKKSLNKFCQKSRIKLIAFKDFSSYPKIKFHQQYLTGLDLDLLVKKNDLPQIESLLKEKGYKLQEYLKLKNNQEIIYYQEKNFVHPQKKLSIDLHLQTAIPHQDEFNFLSPQLISEFTQDLFLNSVNISKTKQKNGLLCPEIEYFLMSLIIHYLGSDLLRGLRNLLDITQFANFYDKQINWNKFLLLSQKLKIKNFSLFLFLLGQNIFNINFPEGLKNKAKIPIKAFFLISYWSSEKIALFPLNIYWQMRNKEAKKIFYENFFLKLLSADDVPFQRLIRPRVLLFLTKVTFSNINKFFPRLYQKSF